MGEVWAVDAVEAVEAEGWRRRRSLERRWCWWWACAPPVSAIIVGVTSAATPQPKSLKMRWLISIMVRVTAPVADEKVPMNSE